MRLAAVASRFNRMACIDAYTGEHAFYAQLGLYDDNKRDSETAERRVLSVVPDTTLPARRVVEAAGTRFILGNGFPDDYLGSVIRTGIVGHVATDLSQIRTISQVCLNQPGFTAWAGRAWVKSLAWIEQNSNLVPQFHLHFALSEPVAAGMLASFSGRLQIVRATIIGSAGTLVATVDEVPEPAIEDATVTGGTYDPVTDTMSTTTQVVRVVRLRWQSLFEYRNNLAPKFGPEDIQVAIAASAMTPRAGMTLTLSDGTWQIASALLEGDVWLCQSVRHV